MLKKFTYTLILFFTIIYWLTTFLICSPTNYIRISLNSYVKIIEPILAQKWTFFTPPPKANMRLYYLFFDKTGEKLLFECEVIEPLQKKKKENPIFNVTYESLDDVISGNAIHLNNGLAFHKNLIKSKFPDSSDTFLLKKSMEIISHGKNNFRYYNTLVNYSKVVAQHNNIDWHDKKIKFVVTSIKILSFSDRYNLKKKPEVSMSFESPLFNLK